MGKKAIAVRRVDDAQAELSQVAEQWRVLAVQLQALQADLADKSDGGGGDDRVLDQINRLDARLGVLDRRAATLRAEVHDLLLAEGVQAFHAIRMTWVESTRKREQAEADLEVVKRKAEQAVAAAQVAQRESEEREDLMRRKAITFAETYLNELGLSPVEKLTFGDELLAELALVDQVEDFAGQPHYHSWLRDARQRLQGEVHGVVMPSAAAGYLVGGGW